MRSWLNGRITRSGALVVLLLMSCTDDGPVGPGTLASVTVGVVLSDTAASLAYTSPSSDSGSLTYVSLPPGTVPNGMLAVIRNLRTQSSVSAAMTDGGLDPVPIVAVAGDTIETSVQVSGLENRVILNNLVPARRRPRVVRTVPPRGKNDVPLNSRVTVVFSEPVDPQTVGVSSFGLRQGVSAIPGQVSMTHPSGMIVEFTPSELLAAGATFEIALADAIHDLDGDALEVGEPVQFTTGTSVVSASIATDQTALFTAGNGETRTFEMSVVQYADGTVTGRYSIFYPGTGGRSGGRITCFAIVDGREFWAAGVTDDAGNFNAVGTEWGWRGVDNGGLGSGIPDQLSFAYHVTAENFGSTQQFCDARPVTHPTQGEIPLFTLNGGNIVVGVGDNLPPTVNGDMSSIAFAAVPSGGIRVMRADGLGSRALTSLAGDWNPAWSPDGNYIAFDRATGPEGGHDVYVMNADGTGLRQLTSGQSFDAHPSWSPDGKRIAFYRDGGISVMNASDGSNVARLTDQGSAPAWSPDGSRIAFWSSRDGEWGVYVMTPDGLDTRRLTSDTLKASNPSWSPDGTRIAFQGQEGIYVMNVDGSNVRRVAFGGQDPTWSPDGSMVLYEWMGLNVIHADGSGLTRRGTGFTPDWSPTGSMPPAPQPFATIRVFSGDGQTDTVRATLAQPLSVRVEHSDGSPVAGTHVNFFIPGNSGSDSVRWKLSSNLVTTNADGVAQVTLRLGAVVGPVKVLAQSTDGVALSPAVMFSAAARAGNAKTLWAHSEPSNQGVAVGSERLYSVFARDGHGSCPDASCGNVTTPLVEWVVTAGGGTITPLSDTTVVGNPQRSSEPTPIARAVHNLGPSVGTHTVTATARSGSVALPVTFTSTAVAVDPLAAVSVAIGKGWGSGGHTCALDQSGAAFCWGSNHLGQTGNGAGGPVPSKVRGDLTFAALGAGDLHSCGLTGSGAAYCWGDGEWGQVLVTDGGGQCITLYDSPHCQHSPALVPAPEPFATITVGGWHACALTATGVAHCWGYNENGQRGDGTTKWDWDVMARPVSGAQTFVSLSAGEEHTCGLTSDGAAYCWGLNSDGQLGVVGGDWDYRTTPAAVETSLRFVSISAGGFHTCGLTATGGAYCWGSNSGYALGAPVSLTGTSTPTAVSGGLTFASVSAGYGYTCGVTTTGAAYCWGANTQGRLGDGTTSGREAPMAVSGGLRFASVSAGNQHTCGLTTESILYCWGSNVSGVLGTAITEFSSIPVKVVGQP